MVRGRRTTGSYDYENKATHQYEEFTSAYAGLPQVIRPDGLYDAQQRFGMYRWHITDPVRFEENIKGNYSPGRSAINSRTHIPVHDVEIFQQNA